MYVYQSSNPCLCGGPSIISDPGCPDTCNCLKLCSITILTSSALALTLCGGETTIDVLDDQYDHDTCVCEGPITFVSEYFDPEVVESVTVDGSEITITGADVETLASNYTEIVLKGSCGTVSSYLTILLGISTPCTDSDCEDGEYCDPCLGCQPLVPDAILT